MPEQRQAGTRVIENTLVEDCWRHPDTLKFHALPPAESEWVEAWRSRCGFLSR